LRTRVFKWKRAASSPRTRALDLWWSSASAERLSHELYNTAQALNNVTRPVVPGYNVMAQWMSLSEAIAPLAHDGDCVALEGFTHLIPFAAGHEIIRQGRRHLSVVRMTSDLVYDQLIGAGCADRLGGNRGVASSHRFRDAVERGWPAPLELEERSHNDLTNAYVAGASNLSFAVRFEADCSQTTPPTEDELGVLRNPKTRTAAAHGMPEPVA
jgi:hypothetical protein